MATQAAVLKYLKEWDEATSLRKATEAAMRAAREFDDLTEESGKNLLERTPRLLDLLSAVQAGRVWERAAQKARMQGEQGALV